MYSVIHLFIDFLLRRLILKCVCYFPEFISFKTFRETSFERIWAKLYCFGNRFWHPFGEKIGPFWGVGSRPHFGPLLELLFWIFGAPGPPRRNPFGSLFGSCCHPEAPWGWKLRILGGSGCRVFFWRDFTPQNGPSFSLNGCQNVFPKQYNFDQILSKEVFRNVSNETNSGK